MTKIILDSSAWVEYLGGTIKGEIVKEYFEKNEMFTTAVCVAEVIAKFIRQGFSGEKVIDAIRSQSRIIDIDFFLASQAGKLYPELRKARPKIALSDVISIVAARKVFGQVITFDNDFKNIPEAILLS